MCGSVGVGGSLLSVLTQFFSNRSVIACRGELFLVQICQSGVSVKVVSHGVYIFFGSALEQFFGLAVEHTAELFSTMKNKLYGCLVAVAILR